MAFAIGVVRNTMDGIVRNLDDLPRMKDIGFAELRQFQQEPAGGAISDVGDMRMPVIIQIFAANVVDAHSYIWVK